jgi:hypothetical protein
MGGEFGTHGERYGMRAEVQLLHIKESDFLADISIHGSTVLMI